MNVGVEGGYTPDQRLPHLLLGVEYNMGGEQVLRRIISHHLCAMMSVGCLWVSGVCSQLGAATETVVLHGN